MKVLMLIIHKNLLENGKEKQYLFLDDSLIILGLRGLIHYSQN